jgi:Predicted metal-dependent phosphoesterases (PHP family)
MTKADLHVHSCFSDRPAEWFLQRLGTRESYTKPEKVYSEAKRRGMTWVTITDHNEIAASILLKEKYPDEVFTGVEVTTYFPENGCKIHVLVYGLNESQFKMINKVRADIYDLRCYIKEQCLAHSVAHATYSINKKLTIENIERLFLLFDYFEGINGSRSRMGNKILMDALLGLTPETIDDLYKKYRIEPYSDTPWIKD